MAETFPPRTLGTVLQEVAARLPSKRAVVFEDVAFTYSEIRERVRTLARGLLAIGLEPGAKVGVWLPNCVEWITLNLAVASIGGVTVPINMRYRTEEAEYILGQSDCEVLAMTDRVQQTDFYAMITEVCPELLEAGGGDLRSVRLPRLRRVLGLGGTLSAGVAPFSDLERLSALVKEDDLARRAGSVAPDDICHIQDPPGTTARPKGALHPHVTLLR